MSKKNPPPGTTRTLSPEDKKNNMVKEFGKEKALDIVHTLYCYAVHFGHTYSKKYWKKVGLLIKETSN